MTEQEAIKLHIAENIHRIEVIEDFLSTNSDSNDKECRKNIDILTKINKALNEVEQYRAIGTPEECRAAVEKQKANKIVRVKLRQSEWGSEYRCPVCESDLIKTAFFNEDGTEPDEKISWCSGCGTKLDWSDEKR